MALRHCCLAVLALCSGVFAYSATAQDSRRSSDWVSGAAGSSDDATQLKPAISSAPGGKIDQHALAQSDEIADIVVTAQRRPESLEKTSVDVSVLSAADVLRTGITDTNSLARALPGVQISTAFPLPQIYIRGVGDFATTSISNPAISANFDGVYIARQAAIATELFDIERIEALKGPQGTLYGRNASGGAVNIITRSPELGVWGGDLSSEFGNLNAVSLNGGINIPVGDTIAIRASGSYVQRNGYTTEDRGDADSQGARMRVLWKPNDIYSLMVNADYGHLGGNGPASVIEGPGLPKFLDSTDPRAIAYINAHVYDGSLGGPNLRPLVVNPDSSGAFQESIFKSVSAEFNADLGFATLTAIPAFRDSDISFVSFPFVRYSAGDAGVFAGRPPRPESSKATSMEVRLGNDSGALKWVLGGYYYRENQHSQFSVDAGPILDLGETADLQTRASAGFAQATYSLTDSFRVIAGARYTSDERALLNGATYLLNPSFVGINPATGAPIFFAPPDPNASLLAENYQGRKTFHNVSWKGGLEYDITPDVLAYATASSGFKAGGFNLQQALGVPAGSTQASMFQPETLTSFDTGVKSRLLNNRLQFNVGAFYWIYKNQQFATLAEDQNGFINSIFDNAQRARLYGADIDVVARPWRGMTLNASVEQNNTKYTKFTYITPEVIPGTLGCDAAPVQPVQIGPAGPILAIDCTGKRLPRAPRWSGNAGFSQDAEMGDVGKLIFESDMSFASSRDLSFDYIAASQMSSYQLYNASLTFVPTSLTLTPDRTSLSITGFVRNIADKAVYDGGTVPTYGPGIFIKGVGLPRTFGVRITMKY